MTTRSPVFCVNMMLSFVCLMAGRKTAVLYSKQVCRSLFQKPTVFQTFITFYMVTSFYIHSFFHFCFYRYLVIFQSSQNLHNLLMILNIFSWVYLISAYYPLKISYILRSGLIFLFQILDGDTSSAYKYILTLGVLSFRFLK